MSRIHLSPHRASASTPHTQGRTIRWARRYDLFVFLFTLGQAGRLRSRTADLAQLTQGEAVLDVGCGTGDLTLELACRVGSSGLVAGIDAAPEMVARARQKAGRRHLAIDFRVEPVEHLSFADQTFDVVVSSLVFHHLPDALKRQALAEIRRVLKPGGACCSSICLSRHPPSCCTLTCRRPCPSYSRCLTRRAFSRRSGSVALFRRWALSRHTLPPDRGHTHLPGAA